MSNPNLKEFALKKTVKKLKARKFIRRRTSKREAEEARYRKRVKVWLVGKICRVCSKPAEVCHHSRGRISKLLLDEKFWIPLCNFHHSTVHDFPETAREQGLLCQPGEWNTIPKE